MSNNFPTEKERFDKYKEEMKWWDTLKTSFVKGICKPKEPSKDADIQWYVNIENENTSSVKMNIKSKFTYKQLQDFYIEHSTEETK